MLELLPVLLSGGGNRPPMKIAAICRNPRGAASANSPAASCGALNLCPGSATDAYRDADDI
jgi:hypothetical protein